MPLPWAEWAICINAVKTTFDPAFYHCGANSAPAGVQAESKFYKAVAVRWAQPLLKISNAICCPILALPKWGSINKKIKAQLKCCAFAFIINVCRRTYLK